MVSLHEKIFRLFEIYWPKRRKVSIKEQTGILLYLIGSIFSIVMGTMVFIYSFNYPLFHKIKIISILWIIFGFIGIFTSDYYLDKRNEFSLKLIFYVDLFNFLSASGFFISAVMCFIGTYFVYEDFMIHNKG